MSLTLNISLASLDWPLLDSHGLVDCMVVVDGFGLLTQVRDNYSELQ